MEKKKTIFTTIQIRYSTLELLKKTRQSSGIKESYDEMIKRLCFEADENVDEEYLGFQNFNEDKSGKTLLVFGRKDKKK